MLNDGGELESLKGVDLRFPGLEFVLGRVLGLILNMKNGLRMLLGCN